MWSVAAGVVLGGLILHGIFRGWIWWVAVFCGGALLGLAMTAFGYWALFLSGKFFPSEPSSGWALAGLLVVALVAALAAGVGTLLEVDDWLQARRARLARESRALR